MTAVLGLLFVGVIFEGADPQAARDLSRRATEVYSQARYKEAEGLYRQAVEAWEQLGSGFERDRAVDMRNLGSVLRVEGRYAEAEQMLNESVSRLKSTGAASVEVTRALVNLAALYRAEGHLAKAETFALQAAGAAEVQAELPGPERIGPRLILASVYIAQQRWGEGERILKSILGSLDGALSVAVSNDLAVVAIARGEFQEAEAYARRALYFAALALPADHPAVAAAWNNLAQACRFEHNYLEAERAYRQALDLWENSLGPWHPDVAKGLTNMAAFYHERGRESGAEVLYRRAAEILQKSYGNGDSRAVVARNELADVLRAERRYSEARKLGRTTLGELEKALPADDARVIRARFNQARLQEETKQGGKSLARSNKPQAFQ